jgi:hypothetical protein
MWPRDSHSWSALASQLPRTELYVWYDDFEWTLRLSRTGKLWMVPQAVVIDRGIERWAGGWRNRLLSRLTRYPRKQVPIEAYWKWLHGFRNMTWIMKHYAGETRIGFLRRIAIHATVTVLCDDRPLVRLQYMLDFGSQGRRGEFRNMSPDAWRSLHGRADGRSGLLPQA